MRQKLINHYRTCSCDRYGQISTAIDIYVVAETEQERAELNDLVRIGTYGGRFGPYKAFNPWGSFKCKDLESECAKAFALNENRKRNLNSW